MPKVYLDQYSAQHVSQRIKEHFPNIKDQEKMVKMVKKLLTLMAPREAIGHYQWHVNVERIGRIVCRGNSIRTVYPFHYNYPGGTQFKVVGNQVVKA